VLWSESCCLRKAASYSVAVYLPLVRRKVAGIKIDWYMIGAAVGSLTRNFDARENIMVLFCTDVLMHHPHASPSSRCFGTLEYDTENIFSSTTDVWFASFRRSISSFFIWIEFVGP
jgi:hypothetical protein